MVVLQAPQRNILLCKRFCAWSYSQVTGGLSWKPHLRYMHNFTKLHHQIVRLNWNLIQIIYRSIEFSTQWGGYSGIVLKGDSYIKYMFNVKVSGDYLVLLMQHISCPQYLYPEWINVHLDMSSMVYWNIQT